ncbi:substrate-binding domain-containing protein [Microbaculum marinum]|uniref:Substrate-binding domain-containing protein n=1 Tax=Microbaculum marinum TaxID=1764581 RepID=A0AAW9RNL3_9HYPH
MNTVIKSSTSSVFRAGLKLGAAAVACAALGYAPGSSLVGQAQAAEWCEDIADGIFCAEPAQTPPNFCGTKEIEVALADGFAQNPWRQMTTAAAINEASRCPNVVGWDHTDGQGNTQKAISDLNGLAARGVQAIVVFPDAGPAMLPAIRDAFNQGSTVVPYRARVGGEEGKDYSVFVGTNFYQDGVDWGTWMAKALDGKGKIAYLGGPAGTSQSRERAQGIADALKDYPDIEQIGEKPFEVTNWDSSLVAQRLTALIAQYPEIDGVIADLSMGVVASGVFERANRELPKVAGEDANVFGCTWQKLHKENPDANFQFSTNSAEQWNVRLAVRWAIAEAAGGTMDEPLVITDPNGTEHVVAKPGEKEVTNFQLEDSLEGKVFCNPKLPESASNGTSLTDDQVLAALKGGL